jgi:pyruvate ferredoxin oxidoreductase alpha subunit
VVALGSVNGTIKDVIDKMRDDGASVGSVSICSFRPFPLAELSEALNGAARVVVVEKSLAPGLGGVVASNVRMALRESPLPVYTVIAGLGGRPVTMTSLEEVLTAAAEDRLPDTQFLDIDHGIVEHEIIRARKTRRSGPTAENILKNLSAGAREEAAS